MYPTQRAATGLVPTRIVSVRTGDLGGRASTRDFTPAILRRLQA